MMDVDRHFDGLLSSMIKSAASFVMTDSMIQPGRWYDRDLWVAIKPMDGGIVRAIPHLPHPAALSPLR